MSYPLTSLRICNFLSITFINALQFTYTLRNIFIKQSVMFRILDDPEEVKALIILFQTETRSTRAEGGSPYYIPEGITLDEHYDLAMEAGMDPQEYVRLNNHGSLLVNHTLITPIS